MIDFNLHRDLLMWITFKCWLVVFHKSMYQLPSTLDEASFVSSLDVQVCILCRMDWLVLAYVQFHYGDYREFDQPMVFSSFPTACYKHRQVGHFVKQHNLKHLDDRRENTIQSSDKNFDTRLEKVWR